VFQEHTEFDLTLDVFLLEQFVHDSPAVLEGMSPSAPEESEPRLFYHQTGDDPRQALAGRLEVPRLELLCRRYRDHNAAVKIKARVEHRLGGVLAATVNHAGSRGVGDIVSRTLPEEITRKQSSRAQQLSRIPWQTIEEAVEEKTAKNEKASLARIAARRGHCRAHKNADSSPHFFVSTPWSSSMSLLRTLSSAPIIKVAVQFGECVLSFGC
jgi:hypothetical protein